MKKIKLLFAALMILVCSAAYAQNITVSGVVKDASNGEAVPFASVVVKGTTVGTETGLDGAYSIAAPSNGTLVISCVGYKTAEIAVAAAAIHNVSLEVDSNFLDETIVVAYGTSTKATFTGSASVVKSEDLEKRQVSNLTQALSGSVAGVQTTSSNGQPGTGATVRIRGFGSINAGMTPLYVVDGVPYDSSNIAAINSQDIESMSVLKDAAAAALYGARGANGVILIQTKKGSAGDAKITFDARVGVNSRGIKNYDVITNTAEYMETAYKALYNAGFYGLGYGAANADAYANGRMVSSLGYQIYTLPDGQNLIVNGKINPAATLGYSDGEYFYTPDDWAANMFSNQMRQEYNLSVSGGSDKLSYYFSAGYLQDGGVILGSGFDRISALAKVDYQAKKWLKLGTSVSYSYTNSRYPDDQTTTNSSGNAFYLANNIAPIYPMFVRDANGNKVYDGKNPIYDYGDGSSTNFTRNWMSISNPIGDLTYKTEEYLADVLNGKVYLEIAPCKGLKLTATEGVFIANTRSHMASSGKYGQSANYGGEAVQALDRTFAWTQQYLATYRNTFGKHTIDALLGYETFFEQGESMEAYGQNLYAPGVWAVNNTIDQRRGYGSVGTYATMGIISRLNYDYNETYFASASYRRDASSRFAPKNRWGNFWSVSAAWNLGNEDFVKSAGWIDLLKLKASFGQQGNDNVGNNYAYLDQYTMSGADGVFSDGNLTYKGNPELTWETTNAYNIGVDFSFFQDRLSGSIEYFSRQTEKMLYYKPVAASNGYSSVPMNIGSMRNSGVEIDLTGNLVRTKNVEWNIFGNATFLKNKVIALSPDLEGKLISGSRIYTEGESMYQLYYVKYAGVDPSTGEALYWAKPYKEVDDGMGGTKQVVDEEGEEYATTNYSVAQATNRQSTGDILPKVSGGFGTSLSAYGIDFSIQFAYQIGGKIMDSGYQSLMHSGTSGDLGQTWHTDIAGAWTPENINTDIPRLNSTDKYANSTSTRFLISSNYLSINNITLGYTFPKAWTKKIGIEGLRIYGAADNLAVFSARKGLDPRQSFTSSTTSLYTALRTISGGIKFTF